MLVNIHFQKNNGYKFFEKLLCINGGLEPRQKATAIMEI